MANLSVRQLDDVVYSKLKLRAANHATSMEEEARKIITEAVSNSERITRVFQKYFGPKDGLDLDKTLLLHRLPHEPMDFE